MKQSCNDCVGAVRWGVEKRDVHVLLSTMPLPTEVIKVRLQQIMLSFMPARHSQCILKSPSANCCLNCSRGTRHLYFIQSVGLAPEFPLICRGSCIAATVHPKQRSCIKWHNQETAHAAKPLTRFRHSSVQADAAWQSLTPCAHHLVPAALRLQQQQVTAGRCCKESTLFWQVPEPQSLGSQADISIWELDEVPRSNSLHGSELSCQLCL